MVLKIGFMQNIAFVLFFGVKPEQIFMQLTLIDQTNPQSDMQSIGQPFF